MAEINETTTSLPQDVMTYYERVFLKRAEYAMILKEGAQMRTHGKFSGKTINFTRYNPLTINATALSEASFPSPSTINASTVAVTLAEYGQTVITSRMHELVSIDANMKEQIELVGQNMGEVLNRVTRTAMDSATIYFPNSRNISTVTTADTLNACACRGMTQTLEIAKAQPYKDGFWLGKTNPQSKYTLIGDSTWINAKTYSDVKDLYKGEMGELYQIRWLLNKDVASANGNAGAAACSTVIYYSYVHGTDAFGCYDLNKPGSLNSNVHDKTREVGESLLEVTPSQAETAMFLACVETMGGTPAMGDDIVRTAWRHAESGRNDQIVH